MSLVTVFKSRGITKDLVIRRSDGTAITPASSDKIRAVIGRVGRIASDLSGAEFVVTSDAATGNGSSFTKNSPSNGTNRLRLDASDLTFAAGVYTLYIDYYDSADANEWKVVDRQCLCLRDT